MEMKTRYLGLDLKNPIVSSASPLNLTVDRAPPPAAPGAAARRTRAPRPW